MTGVEFEEFARQGAAAQAQLDEPFVPCFSTLQDWVVGVFAPTFVRRSTPTFRWCGEWWRHTEALSRLQALWCTWETLRLDPLLGMASCRRRRLGRARARSQPGRRCRAGSRAGGVITAAIERLGGVPRHGDASEKDRDDLSRMLTVGRALQNW